MGAATTAAMAVMTASDGEGDGGAVSTRCAGRGAAGKGRRLQCRPEPPPPPAATGPGSRFDTLVVATSLANEYYTSESALDYFRLIRVRHAPLSRRAGGGCRSSRTASLSFAVLSCFRLIRVRHGQGKALSFYPPPPRPPPLSISKHSSLARLACSWRSSPRHPSPVGLTIRKRPESPAHDVLPSLHILVGCSSNPRPGRRIQNRTKPAKIRVCIAQTRIGAPIRSSK